MVEDAVTPAAVSAAAVSLDWLCLWGDGVLLVEDSSVRRVLSGPVATTTLAPAEQHAGVREHEPQEHTIR